MDCIDVISLLVRTGIEIRKDLPETPTISVLRTHLSLRANIEDILCGPLLWDLVILLTQ